MKNWVLIISLITAFSANAEDSYQNCYGAKNCMTATEYAYQYASKHPEVVEGLYGSLEEYLTAITSSRTYTIEKTDDNGEFYEVTYTNDFYFSLSDDGKNMVIYGPKDNGEHYVGVYGNTTFEFNDIIWDPGSGGYSVNPFEGIEALSFEGNFETVDLSSHYLPNLESLTIPDSVNKMSPSSLNGFKSLTDLTISDKLPIAWTVWETRDEEIDSLERLEELKSYFSEEEYQELHQQLEDCHKQYNWCSVWPTYEGEFTYNLLENLDLNKVNIHCSGDTNKCKENMAQAGYEEGSYNMVSTNVAKNQKKNVKRIYTIDEANQVAGKSNHVKIRYR